MVINSESMSSTDTLQLQTENLCHTKTLSHTKTLHLPSWNPISCMQIMVEGKVVASLDRNKKAKVSLPVLDTLSSDQDLVTLDILVEGIGRDNSGSKFDLKGLMSQEVYLNGRPWKPRFVVEWLSFCCFCMRKFCCFCMQNCLLYPFHISYGLYTLISCKQRHERVLNTRSDTGSA